ncbi:MAG: cupin, partial [Actinomycetota bacterium]
MTHIAIADVTNAVAIQPGAVVSKVVHRDEDLDVTVFGFDAGEGLTEHTASRPAIVQVLSGRLRFT